MLIPERQSRLKELLGQRGMSNLDALATELGVSQSTIRRDVETLEQSGLVERTHGGVIWTGDRTANQRPYVFDQRMSHRIDVKRQIALAAKELVQPNQTILVGGGTTMLYFAQQVVGMPVQLITPSLPVANLFVHDETTELVVTGGVFSPRHGVLLGPTAEHTLSSIHAQTLFFSTAGIHEGLLYNQNQLLVSSEQRMIEQSQKIVLLADSSKFGQQALTRLCTLDEIDVVVSDVGLTDEYRYQIRNAGCQLIIAPAPEQR